LQRTLLVTAAVAASCLLPPVLSPSAGIARTSCVSATNATYRHTFNGPGGTATITAARPLCQGQSQTFSLVSYTAPAASQAVGLFLYAKAHATINPSHRSVTLKVAVPACSAQVYAYFGSGVINETTTAAALYGGTRLGAAASRSVGKFAWFSSGTAACTAAPIAIFASSCDNTFTATLTNPANANTDAVFLHSGTVTRVAPGRSAQISAKKGTTLTLRASNFSTYVGTWRQPPTPCAIPGKPAQTAAAPAPPSAAAATAKTTTPTASTFSAPIDDVAIPPAPDFLTSPTPAASATTSESGMSAISMLAIGLGFLLMACGGILLRRVIRSFRESP
jgi:hypothetical protein